MQYTNIFDLTADVQAEGYTHIQLSNAEPGEGRFSLAEFDETNRTPQGPGVSFVGMTHDEIEDAQGGDSAQALYSRSGDTVSYRGRAYLTLLRSN